MLTSGSTIDVAAIFSSKSNKENGVNAYSRHPAGGDRVEPGFNAGGCCIVTFVRHAFIHAQFLTHRLTKATFNALITILSKGSSENIVVINYGGSLSDGGTAS